MEELLNNFKKPIEDKINLEYKPSPDQQKRLDLLKRLVVLFEKGNIRYSIAGGYGLDGLIGKLTRDHKDFDVFVDSEDVERIRDIFLVVDFERLQDKTSGIEVYIHTLTNTKIDLVSTKILRNFYNGDEQLIIPQTANGSIDSVPFRVATLDGQKIIRDIQCKRNGGPGPNVEHDEKLISSLKLSR